MVDWSSGLAREAVRSGQLDSDDVSGTADDVSEASDTTVGDSPYTSVPDAPTGGTRGSGSSGRSRPRPTTETVRGKTAVTDLTRTQRDLLSGRDVAMVPRDDLVGGARPATEAQREQITAETDIELDDVAGVSPDGDVLLTDEARADRIADEVSIERDPRRITAGTERVPTGVEIEADDIHFGTEGPELDRGFRQEITDAQMRDEQARIAATTPGVDTEDISFQDGGDVTVDESAQRESFRQQTAEEWGVDEDEVIIDEDEGGRLTAREREPEDREQEFLDRATFGLTERVRDEGLGPPDPQAEERALGGRLEGLGVPTFDESSALGTGVDRVTDAGRGAFGTAVDINQRFSLPDATFGVARESDPERDGVDIDRNTVAAAAAVGVAAPEPATSVGGAAVLGGLAVGAVAADTARRRGLFDRGGELEPTQPDINEIQPTGTGFGAPEIELTEPRTAEIEPADPTPTGEVEPSEPTPEIEIGTGTDTGTTGSTGSDTVVPDEFPLPGRDIARMPSEDAPVQPDIGEIVGGVDTAPAMVEQPRQESIERDEFIDRGGIDGLSEEIQRDIGDPVQRDPRGAFRPGRTFPTGGSAVIGGAVGRVETATEPTVTEPLQQAEFGVGTAPPSPRGTIGAVDRLDTAQTPFGDIDIGTDTGLDVGPDVVQGLGTQQALGMDTQLLTESVQATQQQAELAQPTETMVEEMFQEGVGTGPPHSPGRPSRRPPLPGFELPSEQRDRSPDELQRRPATEEFVNPIADIGDIFGMGNPFAEERQ